jgi:hypothetical protein
MSGSITGPAYVPYPVSTTPYGGAPTVANPAYAGTFIPEIWSGKLIEKFYNATVLAAIANTDYEGEIKNVGDNIRIRTKPTITIRPYVADMPLVVERPSSNIVEMQINMGNYFNTILDDVMQVQSDLNQLSMWSDDAAEQMKIVIDTQVLTTLDAGVVAANKGLTAGKLSQGINLGAVGSPVALTPNNVLNYIVDLGTVLDEQNIPETGRWLVIPAWVAGLIKKSDLRNASVSGDGVSMSRNGRVGGIDRFTLYSSNLLPTVVEGTANAVQIFAGHPHGLSFAAQVNKMETLRSEQTFGTLMRGLQVYGSKVLDGIALTELYAVRG